LLVNNAYPLTFKAYPTDFSASPTVTLTSYFPIGTLIDHSTGSHYTSGFGFLHHLEFLSAGNIIKFFNNVSG